MAIGYHVVQPGDELFRILRDVYGAKRFLQDRAEMVAFVKANNPHISNIDVIFPGQVIALPVDDDPASLICVADQPPAPMAPQEATASSELASGLSAMTAEEYGLVSSFGQKVMENGADSFTAQVGKYATASRHNMEKIVRDYYAMQSGHLSRGKYNYSRNVQIGKIQKQMGGLERLFVNKANMRPATAREVLRIQRGAPIRPHQHLNQISNMRSVARTAKIGGRVLKGVSLVSAGIQFNQAETKADRIGIVADAAGGMAGAAAGAALAVVIIGTPAGWAGIAIVFAASTVGGIAAGTTAETLAEGWLADNWKTPLDQFLD